MDKIDKKILDILCKNARTPIKEIAKQVQLSSPAVTTRIARLEKQGVIKGYYAHVDRQQTGYLITAFINIELEFSLKNEFEKQIIKYDNVIECYGITGKRSFLIKAAFPNMMELDSFLTEIQKYGTTSTNIMLSTLVERPGVVFE